MKALGGEFDFILDTIAADHDVAMYMQLLKVDGKCILVGVPPNNISVPAFGLVASRKVWNKRLGIRGVLDGCKRSGV
jgi:uncharacterized zinc-type alcohol dehydrogenase-like protein